MSVLIVLFTSACEVKLNAWAVTFSQTCDQKAKIKSGEVCCSTAPTEQQAEENVL